MDRSPGDIVMADPRCATADLVAMAAGRHAPDGWVVMPADDSPAVSDATAVIDTGAAPDGVDAIVTVVPGVDALKYVDGEGRVAGTVDRTSVVFTCPPLAVRRRALTSLDTDITTPSDAIVSSVSTLLVDESGEILGSVGPGSS